MLIHLNGQLLSREQARIDPFDRGFIFGEGIYEGLRSIAWKDSTRIVGLKQHIRRMQRGLDTAGIRHDITNLGDLSAELVRANSLRDAFVYWQITGGAPGEGDPVRSRARGRNTRPTMFGYCTPQPSLDSQTVPATKRAITQPDLRWHLGWVKSISLMGNVLAARNADERGCDESIFIRGGNESGNGGLVAEGLATNVLLALPGREGKTHLVTPALDSAPMLAGVTRDILLRLDPTIVQRPISAEELSDAREIMLLGTTTMVTSIVQLNGKQIGDGTPGPESRRLLELLVGALREGKDMA
jgi:D-alanine transaminase